MKTIFILITCFFSANLIKAQNVGVGNNNPAEKLDVSGGVKIGYSTDNNGGTIRYNGSVMEYNNGFGWRSMVNNFLYNELSGLTPFNSTIRNSYVEVSGVSLTIPETGVYMVIYKINGYNNNVYFPGSGNADLSGIADFRINGGSANNSQRTFITPSYSYTGTSNRLDFLSNPTEMSVVRQLSAGDVMKIYAEVLATGSTPGQWTINEASITAIRLY